MKHIVAPIYLSLIAMTAISLTPAMAADDDLISAQEQTRQIVVENANQDSEVEQLVAKLKDSQDALTKSAQLDETAQAKADVVETPQVENKVVDDTLFEPKTKTVSAKMPTIFTDAQIELYNSLSVEEQNLLVNRLIRKYGRDILYPAKVAGNYNNYNSGTSYTRANKYSAHSRNYSSAYSTSNYHSGRGCKK